MNKEKIGNRQLFFILFMMRTTVVIAFMPVITSADALQDAWASALLSILGGAALIAIIGGLGIRFPELTVVEYGQKLLGSWLGKGVSIIILLAFLLIAATDTRIYAEMLVTGFVAETPLFFVISAMVLVAAIAAHRGIEVIGRMADFIFPLFLVMIVATLLFPVQDMIILTRNLEPVLARGVRPVLGGGVTATAIASQFILLGILIPHTDKPRMALRTSLWSWIASSLVLVFSVLITIVVLGPNSAARATFPYLTMLRSITVTEFLERMEILVVVAWGFGIFIGLAVFIYSGAKGISQLTGIKDYRPLIWPMAVIWVMISVQGYRDLFQVRSLFQPTVIAPLAIFGWVLIPFGLLWSGYFIYLLKGGGRRNGG